MGRRRLGDVGALGRRPRPRRSGAGPHRGRRGPRSGWRSSTRWWRSRSGSACSTSTPAAPRVAAADDAVRAATEARRVVARTLPRRRRHPDRGARRRRRAAAGGAGSDPRHRRRAIRGSAARAGARQMNAIEVRQLTRRFGAFVAVNDLSFDVRQGEIFGFLGSNGAGKSTTIRMLCGLLRPSSGSARVGGIDVGSQPEAVKQRIGYMSQRFSLYEKLTVDQNITFFGGIYGLDRRTARGAPRGRPGDGRPSRPGIDADGRPVGRLAAAPRSRLRDSSPAADRVSRRTDRRRRSAVAAPLLAADQRSGERRHHGAGHDALPR